MPELPEVETVRRGLAPLLEGRRLTRVTPRRSGLRVPFPEDLGQRTVGRQVERVGRRAKYLRLDLDDGTVLLVHLGMSGRLRLYPAGPPPPTPGAHDHLILKTDAGAQIVLTDARRFGMVLLADGDSISEHPSLAHLGPEPLGSDFTPAYLQEAFARRRTSLKAALLDQKLVAGLGNIYVCEALHRAGLSPRRSTRGIGARRAQRLVQAVRGVLEDAIAAGGSSLRDYTSVAGELGTFQTRFDVYGRVGELCRDPRCSGTIRRIAQAGRSSFYCPACQR